MTCLYGVDYDNGKALLDVNEHYVIVDINEKDVVDVSKKDNDTLLASASWMKVAADYDYPSAWRELAEAAVTKLDMTEKRAETSASRKFRVPDSVKVEAQQALDWSAGFERGHSTIGSALARKLVSSTYVTFADIVRMHKYFNRLPKHHTEAAGWSPGTVGYPTNDRIRYGFRGGDAAREWVTRIGKKHTLAVAADAPAQPAADADKPHEFVEDPEIPGFCDICGRAEDAPVHLAVTAAGFEVDPDAEYFGHGIDPDTTEVDALYVLRGEEWAKRENDQWVPIEPPGEDEVVIWLDPESAQTLAAIIDDQVPENPDILPYELAMLNPHEAALFALAYPEVDWTLVDRVFDIYDSQERSINAGKQVRGPGGKFGDMPDDPESEKETDAETKARLPEALPLVPDVAARIAEYLAQNGGAAAPEAAPPDAEEEPAKPVKAFTLDSDYVNKLLAPYTQPAADFNWVEDVGGLPHYIKRIEKHLREKGMTEGHAIATAVNAVQKMCDTGDLNFPGKQDVNYGSRAEACKAVAEWNEKKARAKADNSLLEFAEGEPAAAPAATAARPLYLAIVDSVDTEAVLDVVSLVPGVNGGAPTMWKRDDGKWLQAPELLAAMQGTTPPPVVELTDDNLLTNVLEQVDKATAEGETEEAEAPGATPQAPDGTSGQSPAYNPDQNGRPAQAAAAIDQLINVMQNGTDEQKLEAAKYILEFKNVSADKRDKLSKKGQALPDGSFPIENVSDLKNAIQAYGRAKNKTAAKKHIIKRARGLGRTDLLPAGWGKENTSDQLAMWGPFGEIMNLTEFAGGADRNRGNAEELRHYWTIGKGGLKIRWNTPGDMTRCMRYLRKYLGGREAGYCALRHKEMTGMWPGDRKNRDEGL